MDRAHFRRARAHIKCVTSQADLYVYIHTDHTTRHSWPVRVAGHRPRVIEITDVEVFYSQRSATTAVSGSVAIWAASARSTIDSRAAKHLEGKLRLHRRAQLVYVAVVRPDVPLGGA